MEVVYFAGAVAVTWFSFWLLRSYGYRACSGIFWVTLALVQGLLAKPLLLFLEPEDVDLFKLVYLRDLTAREYWGWALAWLPFYLLFLAGWWLAAARKGRVVVEKPAIPWFSVPRVGVLFAFGTAGILAFYATFPEMLSQMDKNLLASESLEDYRGAGLLRAAASVEFVASILFLANWVRRRSAATLLPFLGSAAIWMHFQVVTGSRGGLFFSFLYYLFAAQYFGLRRVWRVTAAATAVAMALAVVMTVGVLRGESSDAGAAMANLFGLNLVEHSKTTSIVKAVPRDIPYMYGRSYLDSVLILIPRELFPGKQTVNLDTIVGQQVFNCTLFGACAVPPGLLAESYVNLGFIGLLVLPLLAGWAVGFLDRKYFTNDGSPLFGILFSTSLFAVGVGLLGSGIASVTTHLLVYAGSMAIAYRFAALPPGEEASPAHLPLETEASRPTPAPPG